MLKQKQLLVLALDVSSVDVFVGGAVGEVVEVCVGEAVGRWSLCLWSLCWWSCWNLCW